MKFTGLLTWLSPKQEGVSKKGGNWEKVEFTVVENVDRYPSTLLFTAFGSEKIGAMMGFNLGDLVEVDYDARVRDWTDSQGNPRKSLELTLYTIKAAGQPAPITVAQQPVSAPNTINFGEKPPF